jgi:transposase-like protein
MERAHSSETAGVPTACPGCGSGDLVAPNKTADESAYWRCRRCGEVWNVGRRQKTASTRYDPPRRRY